MKCSYCYYLGTKDTHTQSSAAKMDYKTLEAFTKDYIQSNPGPLIQFSWHGGEPLLAGLAFFEKAVELQAKYLPPGFECWNNIQTNGLLIDNEWCKFFKKAGFDVGVSIDGVEALHDENRKDNSGNPTRKRAASAIKRLMSHGIQPDLLCTVNPANAEDPLGTYRALKAFRTGWVQFIPIVIKLDGSVSEDSVDAVKYGNFLVEVFREWVANDVGKLDVQLFAEISLALLNKGPSVCWMSETCGRVVVVESDGSVFSCDHFVDSAHHIGNINERTLASIVSSTAQTGFAMAKKNSMPKQCQGCQWLRVCNAGCPKDWIAGADGEISNALCAGYKIFFSACMPVLEMAAMQRAKGIAPLTIMQQAKAML
ncbi:MAG: anaerobic sulfatase maturase [Eubacteriaceae bacterium]|nr:anaerobic sulfatase maturase [Eubacteriaceae bacterium]